MDYLNKFGNMLNKGVNVVKQQIQKVNQPQQNTFINQGTYTTQNSSNQNQTLGLHEDNPQSSSSMSAFLNSSPSKSSSNVSSSNPYPTKFNKPANPDQNFLKDFKLIYNETRIDWDNCIIKIDENEFQCKLLVTAFRLYLIPNFITKKEYQNLFPNDFFSLPQTEKTFVSILNRISRKNFR